MMAALLCFTLQAVYAKMNQAVMPAKLASLVQPSLKKYYNKYKNEEYFSGMAFSVVLPKQVIQSYYIGTVSREKNSAPVDANSLFQIGSITKSFTAVKILQLVKAGKLKLTDTVGDYLPQYKKWGHITIEQLLNMTSGLPNYSNSPAWNYHEMKNIRRVWTLKKLIQYVYPKRGFNPPIKQGYDYTNTGYLLAEMIIKKVTHQNFKQAITSSILKPMQLNHTFYPLPKVSAENKKRLMHGYGYNQYDNPGLVGRDMQMNNLTWAASAGGIIANTSDIVRWVQALFINDALLTKQQRQQQQQQLTSMVSLATGKPLAKTTKDDPKGFALGVIQAYNSKVGRFWYYEGETLGFRAFYMYVPCNQIILATTVNSATNGENDHIHLLLQEVYAALLKKYPEYAKTCQK